mgnify:CR=1 FL=1
MEAAEKRVSTLEGRIRDIEEEKEKIQRDLSNALTAAEDREKSDYVKQETEKRELQKLYEATAQQLEQAEGKLMTATEQLEASDQQCRSTLQRLSEYEEKVHSISSLYSESKEKSSATAQLLKEYEEEKNRTQSLLQESEERVQTLSCQLHEYEATHSELLRDMERMEEERQEERRDAQVVVESLKETVRQECRENEGLLYSLHAAGSREEMRREVLREAEKECGQYYNIIERVSAALSTTHDELSALALQNAAFSEYGVELERKTEELREEARKKISELQGEVAKEQARAVSAERAAYAAVSEL